MKVSFRSSMRKSCSRLQSIQISALSNRKQQHYYHHLMITWTKPSQWKIYHSSTTQVLPLTKRNKRQRMTLTRLNRWPAKKLNLNSGRKVGNRIALYQLSEFKLFRKLHKQDNQQQRLASMLATTTRSVQLRLTSSILRAASPTIRVQHFRTTSA